MRRGLSGNRNPHSPGTIPQEHEESRHSDVKKSKNRHLVIVNQLRKREEEWNNRFYLDNIPSYNFRDDRYCETYKQILVNRKKKKKTLIKGGNDDRIIFAPGRIRKKHSDENSSDMKRPESVDRLSSNMRTKASNQIRDTKSREGGKRGISMNRKLPPSKDDLFYEKKNLEETLLNTWDKFNIPAFHREAFLKCENQNNLKQTFQAIRKEIDEIENNHSTIQNSIRAVLARENCLKQLEELIQKIEGQTEIEQEFVDKSSELLTHLRILSLNVVECILRWRESIQQIYYSTRGMVKTQQAIMIPFYYNDMNYLIKMKSDTKDFVTSPLAQFFNFSSKSDPFLVYPSKEINQDQKNILYISKNLINRIRASELVILEESVHDHMADRQSGGGVIHFPQANKIGDSPQSHDHSQRNDGARQPIKVRQTNLYKQQPHKPAHQNDTQQHKSNQSIKQKQNTPGKPDANKRHSFDNQNNTSQPKIEQQQPTPSKNNDPSHSQNKSQDQIKPQEQVAPKKEDSPKQAVAQSGGSVRPLEFYEHEIVAELDKYFANLDHGMKNSFVSDGEDLLARANNGQDPIWFEFVDSSNKRTGFAVANIDNGYFAARRLVILHYSSLDREHFGPNLDDFVKYLWENIDCDEIKISLYHMEDDQDNIGPDKELQDMIKKRGFRWKQLTNDKITGKRYIVFLLKRPEDIPNQLQKKSDEPIHANSIVLVSDLMDPNFQDSDNNLQNLFDNRYTMINTILKHCDEKFDKLSECDSKRMKNIIQVITTTAQQDSLPKIGNKTNKFENLQELLTFFEENAKVDGSLLPKVDPKFATNIFTSSISDLTYRWNSFNVSRRNTPSKNNVKYLRINNNGDLMEFKSKFCSSQIYFIPTDDPDVNVFITENQELIKQVTTQEDVIESVVSKLFSAMERTPTTFKEELWLPIFSIQDTNSGVEDIKQILKKEYKINHAVQSTKMALTGYNTKGNLKISPAQNSKIIENTFLFGILHDKVDYPLISAIIKPENFDTA